MVRLFLCLLGLTLSTSAAVTVAIAEDDHGDCVVCHPPSGEHAGPGHAEDSHDEAGHDEHGEGGHEDDDLAVAVSIIGAAGTSTVNDDELAELQGGGHDPQRSGLNLQQIELVVDSKIGRDARAALHLVQGEKELELEEAYLEFAAPESSARARLGYILAPFGLVNQRHPHAWQWIDQPIIASRLLGSEGSRSLGVRGDVAFDERRGTWLSAALLRADDDTLISFRGSGHVHGPDGHGHGAHALRSQSRRASQLDDHDDDDHDDEDTHHDELVERIEELYGGTTVGLRPRQVESGGAVVAARLSHEWGDECSRYQFGASAMLGPNGAGEGNRTRLWGADFSYRWQPCVESWPFVLIEGEYMQRSFSAPAVFDDGEPDALIDLPADNLRDSGWYAQGLYGFAPRWAGGIRYERATGSGESVGGSDVDPLREDRTRVSPLLAWYPDERTRLRVQWNRDQSRHIGSASTFWFGADVTLGKHRHTSAPGFEAPGHSDDHGDHDEAAHDHAGQNDAGHDHASDVGGHDHVGHDHATDDHSAHDQAGHDDTPAEEDHSGHDHEGHDHEGHEH